MKYTFFGALAALVAATAMSPPKVSAITIDKDNNTNALNQTLSWVGGAVPGSGDIARWNSTVTGANSSAIGGNLSWDGLSVVNPAGAITITHAAGNELTLGASGIDMSSATQNLTIFNTANIAGNVAIGANQTWNVASGRTLQLFSNSNTQNQRLTGSGNIEITGGGIVRMLVGDSTSTGFTGANGNNTYSGNWTVTSGTLRGLRNGTHAWGTGSIILNGGTIGQEQGNWVWSNNITLNSATTSTFDDFNGGGTNRSLKLQGIISGSGNVNFNDSSNRMDANNGFVLTGANTLSGTVTVGTNGNLRVGGVTGDSASLNAGTGGTLGTASVNLSAATSTLTLSHSDAWTFANNVSGSGVLNIGGGVSGAGTQVVTVSGSNTYTGATTVGQGRLDLTGTLTSATTVSNGASISGAGSTTGLLTMNAGSAFRLAGGGATTSLASNGVTFAGATSVRFQTAPVASTTYDVVTYGGGAVTGFSNLSAFAHGTLTDNVVSQKIEFAATGPATRTWDGVTGTWEQGGTGNLWQEGDQIFFDGDTVIFDEPGAAATVTLSGRVNPASVTVNNTTNQYTFTGSAGTNDITGSASLVKNNGGTLAIATQQSYTGGTTINGGIVNLTGGGGSSGTIRGTVTVNAGGTLQLSTGDATGYSTGAERLSTINLNGGVMHVGVTNNQTLGSATINMTGGSITGIAGSNLDLFANGSAINSLASATTSTISLPSMNLRQNNTVFTVADGAATTDLSISAAIGNGDAGNHNMIKEGDGVMALSGANVYTGTTSVNDGTLLVNGTHTGGGSYTVASGAILGGTGSLNSTVAVNTDGTLSPGASIESLIVGPLTMASGSTFVYQTLDSSATGADLLATGALSLTNVTLDLSGANLAAGTWVANDKLTLVSYTGTALTSGFAGFNDDTSYVFGGNTWLLNYDDTGAGSNFANDATGTLFITLTNATVVPEPGSFAMLLFGAASFWAVGRKRRAK